MVCKIYVTLYFYCEYVACASAYGFSRALRNTSRIGTSNFHQFEVDSRNWEQIAQVREDGGLLVQVPGHASQGEMLREDCVDDLFNLYSG